MARGAETSRSAAAIRGGGGIALALMVMNVTTYGFTIASARILGPTDYGALAAWMNLLLVVNVGFLGLQATAARRLSSGSHDLVDIESHLARLTVLTAMVLGVALLALTPVINATLQLHDWVMAALLGLSAVPLSIAGGMAGILQGERRWGALSTVYLMIGAPRLVLGVGFTVWRPDPRWAALAVAVALLAPVAVGLHALRHRHLRLSPDPKGLGSLLREMGQNSQALLAFFAVSNVDLIVARHTLSAHDAGLYAAGLILSKAVLFLPQFVTVVAFPSLAADGSSRTFFAALSYVTGLGALATATTALLPGLALVFVGGNDYADLRSRLWIFAVLGTVLACLMMILYALIARAGSRSVYLMWVGFLVTVGIGSTVDTIASLLSVAVGVDTALVLAMLFAHQRRSQARSPRAVVPVVKDFTAP